MSEHTSERMFKRDPSSFRLRTGEYRKRRLCLRSERNQWLWWWVKMNVHNLIRFLWNKFDDWWMLCIYDPKYQCELKQIVETRKTRMIRTNPEPNFSRVKSSSTHKTSPNSSFPTGPAENQSCFVPCLLLGRTPKSSGISTISGPSSADTDRQSS